MAIFLLLKKMELIDNFFCCPSIIRIILYNISIRILLLPRKMHSSDLINHTFVLIVAQAHVYSLVWIGFWELGALRNSKYFSEVGQMYSRVCPYKNIKTYSTVHLTDRNKIIHFNTIDEASQQGQSSILEAMTNLLILVVNSFFSNYKTKTFKLLTKNRVLEQLLHLKTTSNAILHVLIPNTNNHFKHGKILN